jgi:hypothetical protein
MVVGLHSSGDKEKMCHLPHTTNTLGNSGGNRKLDSNIQKLRKEKA